MTALLENDNYGLAACGTRRPSRKSRMETNTDGQESRRRWVLGQPAAPGSLTEQTILLSKLVSLTTI